MQNKSKIAVIGGTGKSGKYLIQQLLSKGFSIKMLLRSPETFQLKNPLIEIVQGDARDYNSVRLLIYGCGAIISTLGQPKGETPIFSQATTNILRSMNECQIKRYILVTGLNVDTTFDKKSPKTRFATEWMKTNYPETTADRQTELDILLESAIDWTLIRLPLIELADKKGEIKVSLEDCPGDIIGAGNLANFLIEQLTDNRYHKKSPFIYNSPLCEQLL